MKEYILKKYKNYSKFSVRGALFGSLSASNDKRRAVRLQANADSIVGQFTRLSTPLGSDLKLSTAKLTSCDLVSDGPIEGFVNQKGESCGPLEATYLDGTVVEEPKSTATRTEPLTVAKMDVATHHVEHFVSGKINEYEQDLVKRFNHREPIPKPTYMLPINDASMGSTRRQLVITDKNKLENILVEKMTLDPNITQGNGQPLHFMYPMDTYIMSNIGHRYRADGSMSYLNWRKFAIAHSCADNYMSYYRAGFGFRKSPYNVQKLYFPDVLVSNWNMESAWSFPESKPVVYQGSYNHGQSVNEQGRLGQIFCSRAMINYIHFSTTAPRNDDQRRSVLYYCAAALGFGDYQLPYMSNRSTASVFENGRPSKFVNEFATNTHPQGLKEPLIDVLSNKINNLGLDHWKPHKFFRSEPFNNAPRVGDHPAGSDDRTDGLYNIMPRLNVTRSKAITGGLNDQRHSDVFTATGEGSMFIYEQRGDNEGSYGYEDLKTFQKGVKYRITGSFLLPSTNTNINSIRIQSVAPLNKITPGVGSSSDYKNIIRVTGLNDQYPADEWHSFDEEYLHTGEPGRCQIRAYKNNSNPGAGMIDDAFHLNDLAVLGENLANQYTPKNDFGYICFSADKFFGLKQQTEDHSICDKVATFDMEISNGAISTKESVRLYANSNGQPILKNGSRQWIARYRAGDYLDGRSIYETPDDYGSSGGTPIGPGPTLVRHVDNLLDKQKAVGSDAYYWRLKRYDRNTRVSGFVNSWAEGSDNGSDISNTIDGATETSTDYPWVGANAGLTTWYDYTIPTHTFSIIDPIAYYYQGKYPIYGAATHYNQNGYVLTAATAKKFDENSRAQSSGPPHNGKLLDPCSIKFSNFADSAGNPLFPLVNNNFKKNHKLYFTVGGNVLSLDDSNTLGCAYPEVTGFDVRRGTEYESMTHEYMLNDFEPGAIEGRYRSYTPAKDYAETRLPMVTGSYIPYNIGKELTESESNRFKGAFNFPVYLGEKGLPVNADHSLDTNKIFITTDDSAEISGQKIASGISGDYDVFSQKDGKFQYVHRANPNIKITDAELYGKDIELKTIEKDSTLFNFTDFSMDYRFGEEVQEPITNESRTSTDYNKSIFGPTNSRDKTDPHLKEINRTQTTSDPTALGTTIDRLGDYGMRKYSAVEGTASTDLQSDGTLQSDWMNDVPLDVDTIDCTHIVKRKDVDCVTVTFIIERLYQDILTELSVLDSSVKQDATQINFSVFVSFDGVPESIFPAQETQISHFGIVTSFFATDSDQITLPSYNEIVDDYPNEDINSLCNQFPRKVVIRKNDFETNSVRIGRAARVYQVTEVIKERFSYPFSAILKTSIDARTFQTPPNKQYQLRLKKILVPSNYFPLSPDKRDARFVEDASSLGTRVIYNGDWDGTFKLAWSDNPAWILYDLMTNQRYGIGNRIDDLEDINIFNLYKIGRYCDAVDSNGHFVGLDNGLGGLEPRFSCNIMLDSENNAFETIKDISSVFNGMAFWANGSLDFFADQPKETMMVFNNGNVFDGIFNYQTTDKSALFNVADVVYLDKKDDYTAKKETVIDEDGMRQNGLKRRTVTAKGATSRSQARRLGRYILYSNKLEREIVNFKTSSQGLMVSIGDIIEVQDELKTFEPSYAEILQKDFGDQTFAGQGSFRYFKFLGTNSDNTATTDQQSIKEITLIDTNGKSFPETNFQSNGSDYVAGDGTTLEIGPYVRDGLTVTAGYSNSSTYGPHQAFGGSNMWWTLGLSSAAGYDASDNYLTVDFGSAKDISQIQVEMSSYHGAKKLRILASNDPSFNTFTVFGEVIDIADTSDNQNLTVNAGRKIKVSADSSTSDSSLTYPSIKSLTIENRPNVNSILNNHSGAYVIMSTGQDKLVDLYNHVGNGGTIGSQELDDMYIPQVRKLKITGVEDLSSKIKIGIDDTDGYFSDVQVGTLINLDLTNRVPQQYRVLTIQPEDTNLYAISATEYRKEKFDLIEKPTDFTLDETEPYNVGIPENTIKTITQPHGFSTELVNTEYAQKINFTISGDLDGNETIYNINVVHPNGTTNTRRIAKQDVVQNNKFITTGSFDDINVYGTYSFEITSVDVESADSRKIFNG